MEPIPVDLETRHSHPTYIADYWTKHHCPAHHKHEARNSDQPEKWRTYARDLVRSFPYSVLAKGCVRLQI